MDTLIWAVLIIGGIVGGFVGFVTLWGISTEKLRQKTGIGLGGWIAKFVGVIFFGSIAYGAILFIQWAMRFESVILVIVGLIVLAVSGVFAWFALTDDGRDSGYDPMAGKKRHYDKEGNLRGYSDD